MRPLLSPLALAAALTLACVTPAAANDHSYDDSSTAALQHGAELLPTFEALAQLDGFQSGGYASDDETFEFYWHGTLPPEAEQVIADAEADGHQVDIVYTPHSQEQMWDLAAQAATDAAAAGVTVSGFEVDRGNTSITLFTASSSAFAVAQAGDALSQLPAGVEIDMRTDTSAAVTYQSRHDDTGTPNPGSEVDSTGGACTGGLGYYRPSYGFYLLTAAHCVDWADGASATIPGNPYTGSSTFVSTLAGDYTDQSASGRLLDAALIYYSGGSGVATTMFDGSNTSSTLVNVNRVGTSIPYNTPLCSSGSGTGTNCNFERVSAQQRKCVDGTASNCDAWADVVTVDSTDGQIIFGAGDSGAPVYWSDGTDRVVVAIVQGGADPVSCGSANYYGSGLDCSIEDGRVTAMSSITAELDGYDLRPRVTG